MWFLKTGVTWTLVRWRWETRCDTHMKTTPVNINRHELTSTQTFRKPFKITELNILNYIFVKSAARRFLMWNHLLLIPKLQYGNCRFTFLPTDRLLIRVALNKLHKTWRSSKVMLLKAQSFLNKRYIDTKSRTEELPCVLENKILWTGKTNPVDWKNEHWWLEKRITWTGKTNPVHWKNER